MSLVVSAGADFAPAPAGLHQAVCVDVHDLGMVQTEFGTRHKVAIIWVIDQLDDAGKPHEARKVFGFSLSTKARLRSDLEAWRGRPFTAQELLGFDLEILIGVNCQLQIQHVVKADKTYANVVSLVPLAKGMPKIVPPKGYVRRKDRDPQHTETADTVPEDEVPF